MDPKSGAIIDADEKTLKKFEAMFETKLEAIPEDKLEAVRAMSITERKNFANQLAAERRVTERRRARTKAAKKMRQRQRRK